MKFERAGKSPFYPFLDHKGREYGEKDGYIDFGDISIHHLQKPGKAGAKYIGGKIKDFPRLGKGLRFSGNGKDYYTIGIHPEDAGEFVRRFHAYEAFTTGRVEDDKTNEYKLNEADLDVLHRYLQSVGAFPDEEADK